jgi:inner membrane protein
MALPLGISAAVFICLSLSQYWHRKVLNAYLAFSPSSSKPIHMQVENTTTQVANSVTPDSKSANKIVIKAVITGVLILIMLVPSAFVTSLITERQLRQEQVVNEVTAKWSGSQIVTAPYISVPYTKTIVSSNGKLQTVTDQLFILANQLQVNAHIQPELRPRSIYKVLLYKAANQCTGNFVCQEPTSIPSESIQWQNARICAAISDFKGIEERLVVQFNGKPYEMEVGLPHAVKNVAGFSASIPLSADMLGKPLQFQLTIHLKGSEQLHFIPLAGNSSFSVTSNWPNPSFDGNVLPGKRVVHDKGFEASWTFNKANLPFSTVLTEWPAEIQSLAFGVSMLQPADQYAKTMRSAKYAILFIGLTFALFFVIELLQHKPLHPVQYVLVGFALVVFYVLLLALSEFVLFNWAYAAAALATIGLISGYAKSHFKLWKTAAALAGLLSGLYAFIFILIQLEDTALLVGSIGLFAVLALIMYASKKINWYPSANTVA